jgi:hypothetical protein
MATCRGQRKRLAPRETESNNLPAHIIPYCGPNRTPVYLGTTEDTPELSGEPDWSPVNNDIGGRRAIDYGYQREEGMISGTFTRFNYPVINTVRARPNIAGIPGTNVAGDVGTLMIFEGGAYPLAVLFPYAIKAAYAGAGGIGGNGGAMPGGHLYNAAWCWGPDKVRPGTQAKRIQLIFKAAQIYNPKTQGWQLYQILPVSATAGLLGLVN